MPINRLYRSLRDLLVQLRPTERQTRLRNFSWLLAGLFLSRSVHLSKIANKIPSKGATLPSVVRRLSRLVDNASIHVSGLTPDERTVFAYATAASFSITSSYSAGLR